MHEKLAFSLWSADSHGTDISLVSHSLNLLPREAAAPKAICPPLDSVPRKVTRGIRIRPQADSRGYKGTCKKFPVPSAEKDAFQKIKNPFVII